MPEIAKIGFHLTQEDLMSCTTSYEGLDMPHVNVFSDAPQLFWMDCSSCD